MLKRNLIAIVVASLVLVFSSSAFGQWHPEIDRVKSPYDVATGQSAGIKPKSKGLINASTGEVVWADEVKANQKMPRTSLSIKSPRDVATGQVKSPRDVASGQSSEKSKGYNLGDTATHERRKRSQN